MDNTAEMLDAIKKYPDSYKSLIQYFEGINVKEEQLKRLYNAISNLSNLQKRRIILYYFLENTLDEIARQENCSIHSVFVSIERAKDKIKKFMIS